MVCKTFGDLFVLICIPIKRVAAAWLCCLCSGPAAAALCGSMAYQDQPGVRLTSRIELERLIDLSAHTNGVEIEYATNVLRGKSVTYRLVHELSPDELWHLCLRTLHKEGYTLIRQHGERGLFSVVTLADAAGEVLPAAGIESDGIVPGYQSVIVPLRRVTPEEMEKRVSSILKPSNAIAVEAIHGIDGVVVRGVLEKVEVVLGIVNQFDAEQGRAGVAKIRVEHRAADKVVHDTNAVIRALDEHTDEQLQSTLLASSDGKWIRVYGPVEEQPRIRDLIQDADIPDELETRAFDPGGYPLVTVAQFIETMSRDTSGMGSGDSWGVVQDPFTGTLIVTGTPSELQRVEGALQRLADMPPESQYETRLISVHNRDARRVRDIVTQLLNVGGLGGEGGRRSGKDGVGPESSGGMGQAAHDLQGGYAAVRESDSDLEFAVDEEMNVIVATGSPMRIAQVEQLIGKLDVRQPQVQLEVILLSLSESETRDLGVELAGNIDTGETLFGLGSLFGLSSVSPSSTSAQASGSGGSVVILSPGDFSAVFRAIETVNDGRSVSLPSIVVNNNETATLNSTTTQPYLTTTITDSNITTSRGGSASAGTTINVSPQIAAGDHIVLDYSFTQSSFVGESSADGVEPPTQQTSLNSIATIPDGYTIALGGIESSSIGDSLTKTPGLANIPFIGELFKSQSDSTSRSRFYVFIRATVMRSARFDYLKYMSEDLANEVGVDDGWPEVEPRVIR